MTMGASPYFSGNSRIICRMSGMSPSAIIPRWVNCQRIPATKALAASASWREWKKLLVEHGAVNLERQDVVVQVANAEVDDFRGEPHALLSISASVSRICATL
jgi:hypothetical protein